MNSTHCAASPAFPLQRLVPRKTMAASAVPCAMVSLHELVSELVQSLMPLAIKRHSLVLNEIPRDLRIHANEDMLAYVLWRLINGAVQSTHNECIHIETVTVGDRLMIFIKDVGAEILHRISSTTPL